MFNTGEYFATRKKFNYKEVIIEGITFHLIPLTEELIELVKSASDSDELLKTAANCGLSAKRNRIFDDEEMDGEAESIWKHEELDIDCEPSLQLQVGATVCSMSGLTGVLNDMLDAEKEEFAINGDKPIHDISLGDLHADADAHNANMAIAS